MSLKRKAAGALCTLAALLLTGCTGTSLTGQNVEELLRAPQLSSTQNAVQSALNRYLGETLQLKYPRGGDEMAPFLFEDFDGDGETEAAVLYTTEAGAKTARVAILEQADGEWQVACEAEGLGAEVASVETVTVFPKGVQLAVGYANANLTEKYLTVYSYQNGALSAAGKQAYDEYLIADILDEGVMQVAIVPPTTEPGAMNLQLYVGRDGALESRQTVALDERLMDCSGVQLSVYADRRGLVVSGSLSTGGVADELLPIQGAWLEEGMQESVEESTRSLSALQAQDLSGRGTVSIPAVSAPVSTPQAAHRYYFVKWQNYLADAYTMQFGAFDAQTGVYVRLPQTWQDKVTIADGAAEGSWRICSKNEDGSAGDTLVVLRTADRGEDRGVYTPLAAQGSVEVLALFSSKCTDYDRALIERGADFFQ